MADLVTISVFEVVGSGLCVASDDGQKVFEQIASVLRKGPRAQLSFLNVESLTSAFLNAAIGQLYGEFTDDQIKGGLQVSDIGQDDLALLKRVVDAAKDYFKDPEKIKNARKEAMEEGDEL